MLKVSLCAFSLRLMFSAQAAEVKAAAESKSEGDSQQAGSTAEAGDAEPAQSDEQNTDTKSADTKTAAPADSDEVPATAAAAAVPDSEKNEKTDRESELQAAVAAALRGVQKEEAIGRDAASNKHLASTVEAVKAAQANKVKHRTQTAKHGSFSLSLSLLPSANASAPKSPLSQRSTRLARRVVAQRTFKNCAFCGADAGGRVGAAEQDPRADSPHRAGGAGRGQASPRAR